MNKVYAIIDEDEHITLYATKELRGEALIRMRQEMDEYNESYDKAWEETRRYVERHPEILKSNIWGKTTIDRATDILMMYDNISNIMADYGSTDIDFSKITEPYSKFEHKNMVDPECCELREFEVIEKLEER